MVEQIISGPRQCGKTTQCLRDLNYLAAGGLHGAYIAPTEELVRWAKDFTNKNHGKERLHQNVRALCQYEVSPSLLRGCHFRLVVVDGYRYCENLDAIRETLAPMCDKLLLITDDETEARFAA